MEATGPQNQQNEESLEWLAKYEKSRADWLETTKGNLVVAATIIAAMSFQVMVSPPGGVWQNNEDGCREGQAKKDCPKAGTAVWADEHTYILLVRICAVSFSASMFLILLLVSGARLRTRWVMGFMILAMLSAIICISIAFFASVALVAAPGDLKTFDTLLLYVAFWLLVTIILGLFHLVRILSWIYRSIYRCCCARPQRHTPAPGLPSVALSQAI